MEQINRYVIKWNNGVWKIFDRERYEDCEIFPTYKEAEEKYNG